MHLGRATFAATMICTASLLAAQTALAAGSSRGHGQGGRFAVYYPIIKKYNKSGELFRIEGVCRSACTLFLSIRNVCVDRKAFVSFHAGPDARTGKWGRNSSSTRTMLSAYKPKLREYLLDGHHVDSRRYHTLKGAMLIDRFGYKECKLR
ncbi:MAG: hypothetical protein AB7K67_16005 [Hyphomicrobiaceae bacterium]